jgi:hypothetical protein
MTICSLSAGEIYAVNLAAPLAVGCAPQAGPIRYLEEERFNEVIKSFMA